jgi:DNA-binding NtrC family response regulator
MGDLNKQRILVVDDEKVMRDLVAKILGKAGHEAETAECGHAALDRLRAVHFDMVISDVKMPDMTGLELLKKIRQNHSPMAVVVMTGHADTYTIKDALMHGADEYITKPFKHYEVVAVVERALWRMESAKANP